MILATLGLLALFAYAFYKDKTELHMLFFVYIIIYVIGAML